MASSFNRSIICSDGLVLIPYSSPGFSESTAI
jgi:hypothetical protein